MRGLPSEKDSIIWPAGATGKPVLIALSLSGSDGSRITVPDINPATKGEGNPAKNSVLITNFAFDPQELNISDNTPVTWTNDDAAPHTVVTDAEAAAEFKSPSMKKGETFTFNFTRSGNYPYHCSIHPSMAGIIRVNP